MTATPAKGGVPAAGAGGQQQHRVLQQQEAAVYTEDPTAAAVTTQGAAAPPPDAASAVAAALGQPAPAPGITGWADAAAGAPPSLSEHQQAAGANSQQPSDFAYDMFETPAAASADQQQAAVSQPQPQAEQLPAAPPAAEEEDQSTNPPNDNSELLPPEAAKPPALQPPNPPPANGGGDGGSSGGNQPAMPGPPQTPPGLDTQPWLNPSLPLSERISSLLKALTLEEKIPMMIHGQAGVPRLSLKPFQFWTGRGGGVNNRATVYTVYRIPNTYCCCGSSCDLHINLGGTLHLRLSSPCMCAPSCSPKQRSRVLACALLCSRASLCSLQRGTGCSVSYCLLAVRARPPAPTNCCTCVSLLHAECLHGHQERYDGLALPTIFPQPLMLAGTFDPQLAFEVR